MPKCLTFFSYTRAAAQAIIDGTSDRGAAAKALVESLGGSAVETTDGMVCLKCYRTNVPG